MALWEQGFDIFSSLLPLCSITLPYTLPPPSSLSSYIYIPSLILPLGKNEVTYYIHPKWDLIFQLGFFKTYSFAMPPSWFFSLSSEDVCSFPFPLPQVTPIPFSVQHMKVLHTQISDLAIPHTCFLHGVPFFAYTILVSVLLWRVLPWLFQMLPPPLFFFMRGSETNSSFWHWVRMTQNPIEE